MPKLKIVSFLLACLLTLGLISCSDKAKKVAVYSGDDGIVSHMVPLYEQGDEYALLYRKYGSYDSRVAVGTLDGDKKTLYETGEESCIYELYAKDGLIAFYDMTPEGEIDVYYRLKVIDAKSGEVYSPYSKLICEDGDVQPRFLAIVGRDVYYVTSSLAMSMSRVMKYTVGDERPVEFISTKMTENDFTYGHSHTFVRACGGNIVVSRVDGYDQYIDVYDAATGKKKLEKALDDNVAIVYNCDYDEKSGVFALYYGETVNGQFGNEAVGFTTVGETAIKKISTLNANSFLEREDIRLYNNLILLSMGDSSLSDTPYESYHGVAYNIVDAGMTSISGALQVWIKDDELYDLSFDKKEGADKLTVTKRKIESDK